MNLASVHSDRHEIGDPSRFAGAVYSRRLREVGRLAASVAREMTAPLAEIQGSLAALATGADHVPIFDVRSAGTLFESGREKDEGIDLGGLDSEWRAAMLRADETVSELEWYARSSFSAFELLADVPEALDTAHRITRPEIERAGAFSLELPALPKALIARGDLVQILVNLFSNAADAIADVPGGGLVRVEAGVVGPGRLRLGVHDDGCGIDPAIAERIFEPGFTTRRAPGREGLGLFVSRRLAERAGGSLHIVASHRSTTAFLELPAISI